MRISSPYPCSLMNILSGLMSPCRIPMSCRAVRARRMSATKASAEASAMNGWLLMMSSKVPPEYRGSTRKDVSVMMQALSTVTNSSCIQPMIMTEQVPRIQQWTVAKHNYVCTYAPCQLKASPHPISYAFHSRWCTPTDQLVAGSASTHKKHDAVLLQKVRDMHNLPNITHCSRHLTLTATSWLSAVTAL